MTLLVEKLNRAFELFDRGDLANAEALYNECLSEVSDTTSDEYTQILHGLGYVKAHQQQYDEARHHYKQIIDIALVNNHEMDHCIAVHQLGMVERMAECYGEALRLFQNEAKLLKDYKIDSSLNWSANYYEQGYIALLMNNLELAEQLMKESLQFATQSEDNVCLGCAYRGFGEIYLAKGEESLAKQSFLYAREAFEKANDKIAVQGLINF